MGFQVDAASNYLENKLFPAVNRSFARPLSRVSSATARPNGGRMGHEWGRTLYLFVSFCRSAQKCGTFIRKSGCAALDPHGCAPKPRGEGKQSCFDVRCMARQKLPTIKPPASGLRTNRGGNHDNRPRAHAAG